MKRANEFNPLTMNSMATTTELGHNRLKVNMFKIAKFLDQYIIVGSGVRAPLLIFERTTPFYILKSHHFKTLYIQLISHIVLNICVLHMFYKQICIYQLRDAIELS